MNEPPFCYKAAKFVKRLYKIVCDPSIKEIRWSPTGTSFLIDNKEEFLRHALPLISKTKEYSAFVRLLNHYGFNKLQNIQYESEEYFHKYFVRNREENLVFITRVKNKKVSPKEDLSVYMRETQDIKQQLDFLIKKNLSMDTELNELRERVDKQDKTIGGLIEVLSRVFSMGIKSQQGHKAIKGDSMRQQTNNFLTEERIRRNFKLDESKLSLSPKTFEEEEDEEINFADFF